jgi:HlyD family secretion protein
VGAQPDDIDPRPAERKDSVRWISREPPHPEPVVREPWPVQMKDWFLRTPQGRAVGITLILLLLLALGAYVWSNRVSLLGVPPEAPASEPPPLVSVVTPGISAVAAEVTFTGTIAARYDIPISAEGDGGRITAVLVETGDKVKRGQVLARIDQSVLRPQVTRLAASLEEARAQASLSAAEYERAMGVSAAGALSKEEIERRRAASVTDEARVKVAAAQLAESQARLGRSEVRAPEDGLVLTRTAEVGQNVTPGSEPLFRLARDGEIRISLQPDPALRPGAFARGQVVVSRAERPVLPQTAVMSDEEGTYVFVVNEKSEVERRNVTVANTVAQGLVISSGLNGQERVITTAGGFLRPAQKVEAFVVKR